MLKESDNLIADSLFKTIGAEYFKEAGTWQNGQQAIRQILSELTNIDSSHIPLFDGSGLSRYNYFTPQQIIALLTLVSHTPIATDFIYALPIAGIDGTLEERFKDAACAGKIRAKTGTESGISSLSGYLETADHRPVVFAIMINGFIDSPQKYKELEDQISEGYPLNQNKPITRLTIIFITSIALFMEALDATILNTAIPSISNSLHINPVNLKIALISYLLSLAIFIPISTWVADRYGAKRVFIYALSLFALSSFYCGFAQHLYELVIGRFLQGMGGALMTPTARLILLRNIDKHEFVKAMGFVIILAAVGMMLGPLLGGFIINYFSWPWIFWVNIPASFLAIFIATRLGKNQTENVPPLDIGGFILFGLGLASFSFALSTLSESSISKNTTLIILLCSLILLLAYHWHSRKNVHPIINPALFQLRTFKLSILSNIICRIGFDGTPFLLPLMLQIGLGYSPFEAGLLISPLALGIILAKPFCNFILHHLGFKKLLIINTLLLACSLESFLLINTTSSAYFIALLTTFYGFFLALQYTGMNSLAYADQSKENYGNATSVLSTTQRLAQSFGVATSALLIRYYSPNFHIEAHLELSIFQQCFFTMGILTLFSSLIFIKLRKHDGEQMMKAS